MSLRHAARVGSMVAAQVCLILTAVLAGLLAAAVVNRLAFHQSISWGDLKAMTIWGVAVMLITFPFVYVPLIEWLRDRGASPAVFLICFAAVAIIPTVLAGAVSGARNIFTAEQLIRFSMFGTASIVLGFGQQAIRARL